MFATKIFGTRDWRGFSRSLVALTGILVLTTTLASRTFEVQFHTRTSVSVAGDKAKIQHREKQGSQWSPTLTSFRPFYVPVIEPAVDPEQEILVSMDVDDCLYNRPPPRS